MQRDKVFATRKIKFFFQSSVFTKGVIMSADPTLLQAAKFGNLAKFYTSEDSIWDTKSFARTNTFVVDNTFSSKPTGQPANFGGTDRFRLRKRGGRVAKTWLKINISAGILTVTDPVTVAAYHEDLGQLILGNVRLEYASKEIQQYNGEMVKAYKRLMEHDITKEHYNATNQAMLPPGPAGWEAIRVANVTAGVEVLPELEWLYFTRSEDYAQTPEALSSELELVIDYARLENLIYARVTATGAIPVGEIFTTRPAITSSLLFTQLVHCPGPEKELHLRRFDTNQGVIYKILDVEQQLRQSIAAAAGVYTIKLDNFRLDSQFIMFYVRKNTIDVPWAVDRMQSDTTATILTAVNPDVSALLPITSFRVIANGKTIIDTCTDRENRHHWRKLYFPGGQVGEPIYFIPFSEMLRDHRNVVNFQNLANLGTLELELTMPVAAVARFVDVYNICHNIVQMKMGDIIRLLR